ncbi:hypothetical protein [Desulfacinum infernum]|nr:hypothetical protein [Desulfacinum infernum]
MTSESIHGWAQQLFSFFINAYHLQDALIVAASSGDLRGLKRDDIETAITNDPMLALLADLANLDKHCRLTKTRSGDVPVIQRISGVDSAAGNGWLLSVKIEHGTVTLDGLTVAKDAIAAWQEKLSAWGIL